MKNNILFKTLFTLLVVCSALFAKYYSEYSKHNECVAVMAQSAKRKGCENITFTDLAERLNDVVNGGAVV